MSLTLQQDASIAISMRVCGAISLVGCLFIVTTFTCSKRFRRPVNRLIFYASWGNIVLAVMSILSVDPIFDPYGEGSSLCTAQGFMIQMFLPSDALWNLAMAINVYLTIFKRWEVDRMKRLEIWYATFNFGAPFIIAFAYLFIDDSQRGRIYGPASIWCWVTSEWEWLRIGLLYAPSWICIVVIFGIYVAAGLYIYEKRRGLNSARITPPSTSKRSMKYSMRRSFVPLHADISDAATNADPFKNAIKTTEIKVTSERAPGSVHELAELGNVSKGSQDSDSADGSTTQIVPTRPQIVIEPTLPARTYEPYTVTINGGVDRDQDRDPGTPTRESNARDEELGEDDLFDDELLSPTIPRRLSYSRQYGSLSRLDNHTNRNSAMVTGTTNTSGSRSRSRGGDAQRRQVAMASRQQTRVAWGYTKVALLYFLSLLCTWVPSSVNRVYSLVHGAEVNYALSMAAAFVLPLVGFWNALIYMVTSWDAVRETWWECVDWISGQSRGRKRERGSEANIPRRGPDGRW